MTDRIRAEQARADSQRVDKLIGEVLANRYQIEHRLGEGAMGSVYRARHIKVGRPFAVKVLHPRLLEDEKTLQRFEREAELAGRLHHPNVIGVVDVGETQDGLRYMVMDFAEGHDLASLLAEAPMPPERIITLTRQMLEGLYHAHEAGLIHRDFKPENVIVEKDTHGEEVPRIVDFGIAILREGGDPTNGTGRLTTNGLVLGTPHYMAPEQAVNDPIDHRIDLFALGIMVYEMLCGKLPFDGHGAEVARANLLLDPPLISDRVPYLEVDPLLEAFARRMMLKKREARPATAKAAREILDLIVKDREAAAAQLNVPLAAARGIRSTEPVQARHIADTNDTFPPTFRDAATPKQAPTMGPPVAIRTKTPPRGVETVASDAMQFVDVDQPIATDEVVPLTPKKKNRAVLIAGLAAAVLVLAVIVAVALKGDKAKVEPPPVVHDIETPVAVNEPKVDPTKTKVEAPPPPVVDNTPPPVVNNTPPVKVKPGTGSAARTTAQQQVKVDNPVKIDTPPPKTNDSPTKIDTPKVEVAKVGPYDSAAFRVHWQSVGQELMAYSREHGVNSVSDLQSDYNTISYMSAAASQDSRDAARKKLDQIHAKLAARK
ncbi:MAG: protein kinase [Kofleriaceae bacterium]